VSVTSPAGGSTVSGSVAVVASASDNVGVTKVEFFAGSTQIGTSLSSPYQVTWDSTAVPNGSYQLTAKAYDAAGNSSTSAAVTVNVSNVPSILRRLPQPPTAAAASAHVRKRGFKPPSS
jgi:hypothetical protein